MSDPSIPETAPGRRGALRLARTAAVLSNLAAVLAVVVWAILFSYLLSSGKKNLAVIALGGILPLVLLLAGTVLGIVGLAVPKKDERPGIFGKALIGISINLALLIFIVGGSIVYPLLAARNYPRTPEARLQKATNTLATASGTERFYALNDAAKESFETGKIEDARKYAAELLTAASNYPSDWNYGNAIQDGNIVLGRIAVRENKIDDAKQHLLAAGNSHGSPQMNSFGPNLTLARDLLEKGETNTVLQYFNECSKFWKMDYGKLDDWSNAVKTGQSPNFGANLLY